MIESYQDMEALEEQGAPDCGVAIIKAISGGKAQLTFADGTSSTKYYILESGIGFNVGDKVRIMKRSGTYIVMAILTDRDVTYDKAKDADNATNAVNATNAANATNATSAETALQVKNNDNNNPVLFSANPANNAYYMWSTNMGWRRIDN